MNSISIFVDVLQTVGFLITFILKSTNTCKKTTNVSVLLYSYYYIATFTFISYILGYPLLGL